MRAILARLWRTGILANLLTGVIVLLPLVLTVLIIGWLIGIIAAIIGPGTWFGELLTSGGAAIVGQKREVIAFTVGAALGLVGLWLVGVLVRIRAKRAFDQTFDEALGRVPLFRAVYRPVSQVVRLLAGSNPDLTAMSVVMCRLGGKHGGDVPALLASQEPHLIGGERRFLIYLPTSPLPAWGGLIFVPESSVIPAPAMDADALIKLYLSFGVLASEVMPAGAISSPSMPASR